MTIKRDAVDSNDTGVVILQLNQPDTLNALTVDIGKEFQSNLAKLKSDDSVRCLILTGSGRAFSAGGDLEWLRARNRAPASQNVKTMENFYGMFLSSLLQLPFPTIAAVNGLAVGAGACLPLACDIRLAGDKAKFAYNFVRLGIPPGMGGSYTLQKIIGHQRASKLLLTGTPISAKEAKSYGLVLDVIPQEELQVVSLEMAREIAKGSPVAIRETLKALRLNFNGGLVENSLAREALSQAICMKEPDYMEGLNAVSEKRSPKLSSFFIFTLMALSSAWLIIPFTILGTILLTLRNQPKPRKPSKKVVIIGASSGIGRDLAIRYAKSGASIVITSRRRDKLEEVAALCNEDTFVFVGDMTHYTSLKDLFLFAKSKLGGIDTLILSAGVLSVLPFERLSEHNDFEEIVHGVLNVNAISPILATRVFLPDIIEHQGQIVRSLYTASKHAVTGFFRSLRIEVAGHGVHICHVMPGSVDTDLRKSSLDGDKVAEPEKRKKIMSAEQCGSIIFEAARLGQNEVYIPKIYQLAVIVSYIFPGLINYFAAKKYGYTI
ncbi:hypothetical protein HDV02_002320 [Globomyces sp. JEL0801]|nr:hypothetical protein HDV02_002320 [Globomyces sp. JEL0801]